LEVEIEIRSMEINIENIKSREFNLERKGYKKEEVKQFLDELVQEFEANLLKNTSLEEEVNELSSKLEEYQKIEKDLRDAVILFKESEKDTLIKSNDQAAKIIESAEQKSKKNIHKAEQEVRKVRDTIIFLKEQGEIFIARLKIIIDSQEGMLNDLRSGSNIAELQKTMAEAAAFKSKAELNIDSILERLL